MIKIALFDLDGVIIKDPIFSSVYAQEFGMKPEDMLPFFSNEFQKCLIGEADLKHAILPYLPAWKWSHTADELVDYWIKHHQTIDTNVTDLIAGMRIRGMTTGLTTNQEKYRTDYVWNKLGLKNYFDHLFVSNQLHTRKPQTNFFQRMLTTLRPTEANEILFIDDSMNNISVAQNFGLKTHYYTNFENLKDYVNYLYETQNR